MTNLADFCTAEKGWRLFYRLTEESYAEPPEWIPYLPSPGTFQHPRYGEIEITPERNSRFVRNFTAGIYQQRIPLDAEHETKVSGAVGWIVAMRQTDDGAVDAQVEWTDRGKKLLESDRFRYVSPEWYSVWTDPATEEEFEDVAIGGALTTRPFFKENYLRPLVANEDGLSAPEAQSERIAVRATKDDAEADEKPTEDISMAEKVEQKEPEVSAKQFAELSKKLETMQEALAAKEAEAAELSQAKEKFTEALDKANERVAKMEKENRERRFSEVVAPWVGDKTTHVGILEALGEGSDAYQSYVELQNGISEQAKTANLFDELGTAREPVEKTAHEKIEEIAVQLMESEKITRAAAITRAATENPSLYEQYKRELR